MTEGSTAVEPVPRSFPRFSVYKASVQPESKLVAWRCVRRVSDEWPTPARDVALKLPRACPQGRSAAQFKMIPPTFKYFASNETGSNGYALEKEGVVLLELAPANDQVCSQTLPPACSDTRLFISVDSWQSSANTEAANATASV